MIEGNILHSSNHKNEQVDRQNVDLRQIINGENLNIEQNLYQEDNNLEIMPDEQNMDMEVEQQYHEPSNMHNSISKMMAGMNLESHQFEKSVALDQKILETEENDDMDVDMQKSEISHDLIEEPDAENDDDWVEMIKKPSTMLEKCIQSTEKSIHGILQDQSEEKEHAYKTSLKSILKKSEGNINSKSSHVLNRSEKHGVQIVTPENKDGLNVKAKYTSDGVKIFNPDEWNIRRFQIGLPLSRGKFGHVLLVREKQTKFLFVLKMMFLSQLKKNPKYMKNFRREVEIHARLEHPNILKMHGFFKDAKKLYLILEFCPDGELFTLLQSQPQKRFTEEVASNYIQQMIHALIYLHSKDIIHRDIKPENILVDGDTLKLADFGWSIYTPKGNRKTFCGTLDYLPPEMVKNNSYDKRVDVWSIGVLAYEL